MTGSVRLQGAAGAAPARPRRATRTGPRLSPLGLLFLAPALLLLAAFFLAPAALTGVFAFTDMSTSTGIGRGDYMVTPNLLRDLRGRGLSVAAAEAVARTGYSVDAAHLQAAAGTAADPAFLDDIRDRLAGQSFGDAPRFEAALRALPHRPASVRALKRTAAAFSVSPLNTRFATRDEFAAALDKAAPGLAPSDRARLLAATYTGPVFTAGNFRQLLDSPSTPRILLNTLGYVGFTLVFGTGTALFLAVATFYLPRRAGSLFNALWLLPRITPVVLYAVLWKWMSWEGGFVYALARALGLPAYNYMTGGVTSAWVVMILSNGFVGASFGMILFAGALRAIPVQQLWASEVDGASRWQQVTRILLPQLRWPILFVLCYQTLSLLSSYELIWLTTDGGPGLTTTVWALDAFKTALVAYSGEYKYGLGAAMALILVVVGLVLSIGYLVLFRFDDLVGRPRIEF